MERKYIFPNYN